MPGWSDPEHPSQEESFDPPPPPPHVVNPWAFPVPSPQELTAAIGAKDLAYLASLALRRTSPEIRVLAKMLVRLHDQGRNDPCSDTRNPPGAGTRP
jgi:hypothetical protein